MIFKEAFEKVRSHNGNHQAQDELLERVESMLRFFMPVPTFGIAEAELQQLREIARHGDYYHYWYRC